MADIFISYSKVDHALALKLSAYLESEGWSVWWDKNLAAGDLHRDEIMKQLVAARAVITIWTENSIKSDWVRAESGRAKADGKLIPVKTPEVAYAYIPLPFGEMHTENASSTELIRAAIVAQLAKPQAATTASRQFIGFLKYQALTWIGIIGSSITVFANLHGVLNLADWARALVRYWREWTYVLWRWLLALVAIEVPKEIATQLSFTAFTLMLVLGSNLSRTLVIQLGRTQNTVPVRKRIRFLADGVFVYLMFSFSVVFVAGLVLPVIGLGPDGVFLFAALVIPVIWLWAVCEEEPGLVMAASLLFVVMGICLLVIPFIDDAINAESLREKGQVVALPTVVETWGSQKQPVGSIFEKGILGYEFFAFLFLFQICWMGAVLFSPLKQLTRRLGCVVVGVITLGSLSEISKFNLHQYLQPPKVSDNSVR